MADWVVLTGDELGANRVFTAPTAQALYDNPIAAFEGAEGAPELQTAAIADAAVTTVKIADANVTTAKIADEAITPAKLVGGGIGQASLHTNAGTGSGSGMLPGGQYGFYPRTQVSSNGLVGLNDNFSSSLSAWIHFEGGGSWAQRYVTASPPFDLGDGEVRGFIYLLMRSGAPVGTWCAAVPPWAYNGPTDIRPHVIDAQGRKLRRAPKCRALHAAFRRGDLTLAQYRDRLASPGYQGCELVEIDQAMKQADMGLIPHPFAPAPGDVVVLLDPMDPVVAALIEAQEYEDVTSLLLEGKIRPDNEPLARKGPAGVLQARVRS